VDFKKYSWIRDLQDTLEEYDAPPEVPSEEMAPANPQGGSLYGFQEIIGKLQAINVEPPAQQEQPPEENPAQPGQPQTLQRGPMQQSPGWFGQSRNVAKN